MHPLLKVKFGPLPARVLGRRTPSLWPRNGPATAYTLPERMK